MRFSVVRLLLFGGVGSASLVFLAWYDPPADPAAIDAHTGERIGVPVELTRKRAPMTAGELRVELATLADARLALAVLRDRAPRLADDASLVALERTLEEELAAPDEAVAGRDPADAAARVARRAAAARKVEEAQRAPPPTAELLHALRELELDDVSAATEALFAPAAEERLTTEVDVADAVQPGRPADLGAALALAAADGEPSAVPASTCVVIADAFRAAGRTRARMRWMLRAFAAAPADPAIAEALAAAYLEHARHAEALAVLGAAIEAGADTEALWRRRAQVAVWRSRPDVETLALEGLVERVDDLDARRRLVELHAYYGDPEAALRHAEHLARADGGAEAYGAAADRALIAGEVDRAVALLRSAAERSDDPGPYATRIVRALLEDLRVDEAIAELRALEAREPDGGHEEQLLALLRSQGRRREYAVALRERFERDGDPAVERELLGLLVTLGDRDGARELMAGRMRRADAATFVRNLPAYRSAGVPGVADRAREWIRSGLDEASVARLAEMLGALADEPPYRAAAADLVERYPAHPATEALALFALEWEPTPAAAATAAERLARRRPASEAAQRAWIDRAAWADLPELELRARESRAARHPEDLENRRRTAELLEATGRIEEAAEAWRTEAEREGAGSPAEARLVELLTALGRDEEALALLDARAARGELPLAERRALAERFFGSERVDRALQLFESVLAEAPDDRLALLRIGQSRAWANDPNGALPYFERLVEIEGPANGEGLFFLGETYWSTQRHVEGRGAHEQALGLLREVGELTPYREAMVAKVLARLDHVDESAAVYERLTANDPSNQALLLDYADAMVAAHDVGRGRSTLERARPLDPDDRRFLRLDGQIGFEEERFDAAAAAFERALELHGPDAGVLADLGRALHPQGRLRGAHDAFTRSLALQPDNRDVAWVRRSIGDETADWTLEAESGLRTVGDDDSFVALLEGSTLLGDDRTRLSAGLERGSYTGRANAFRRGREDVDEDITALGVGACHALEDGWAAGAGLDVYSGRPDASSAGGWIEVARGLRDPYRSFSARAYWNEPLADPPAAVGLGGTRHGAEVEAYHESDDAWWWVSGKLGYRSLSIEHPRRGRLRDGQLHGELVLGRRVLREGPEIRERVRHRRCRALQEGTTTAGEPPEEQGPRLDVWLGYSGIRLLDDEELDGPLPLGDSFDYVTVSGRAVGTLTSGLYWEAEAYAGVDAGESGLIAGARLGLAWRPEEGYEVRLAATRGEALGRGDSDGGATGVELALTLRW